MNTPTRDDVRTKYASYHRKPLTIEKWLNGEKARVAELLVNSSDGSVHINFIGSLDPDSPFHDAKIKHMMPSGDAYFIKFGDYFDPDPA